MPDRGKYATRRKFESSQAKSSHDDRNATQLDRFGINVGGWDGEPAILLRVDGHPFVVVSVTIAQQHIVEIRVIGNPEKLRHLE